MRAGENQTTCLKSCVLFITQCVLQTALCRIISSWLTVTRTESLLKKSQNKAVCVCRKARSEERKLWCSTVAIMLHNRQRKLSLPVPTLKKKNEKKKNPPSLTSRGNKSLSNTVRLPAPASSGIKGARKPTPSLHFSAHVIGTT